MYADPAGPTAAEYILIVLGFIALWCLQSYVSAMASGWQILASRFGSPVEYLGETITIRRFPMEVCMRFWMDYTNVVQLASDEESLHLSVFFPFRVGHPPLFIPWHEIHEQRADGFWRSYMVLYLGGTEQIPMRLSVRLANDLREAKEATRTSFDDAPKLYI